MSITCVGFDSFQWFFQLLDFSLKTSAPKTNNNQWKLTFPTWTNRNFSQLRIFQKILSIIDCRPVILLFRCIDSIVHTEFEQSFHLKIRMETRFSILDKNYIKKNSASPSPFAHNNIIKKNLSNFEHLYIYTYIYIIS